MITIAKTSSSDVSDFGRLQRDSDLVLTQPKSETKINIFTTTSQSDISLIKEETIYCKICLSDISVQLMCQLQICKCYFCKQCMAVYVADKIREGNSSIECPNDICNYNGRLTLKEVESFLEESELFLLYLYFKKDIKVTKDPLKIWCPLPDCETIIDLTVSKFEGPQCCTCPTCNTDFCVSCSELWHPEQPCHLSNIESLVVPNNDKIKRCPSCKIPIERNAGCAHMICKECKHMFCWYCLNSLNNDALLIHYSRGHCKNNLGHSRIVLLWYRVRTIGYFLLLVMISPFIWPYLLYDTWKQYTQQESEK
uniref:RBR-type E3 ubiquitin transferase n=1 Tax=Trachysalambria curvirostris majanivirus TaxID=2984281 RepID=A0A9C7F8B2_9VIRU|nr:MAG: hypothetical protein [Trachysalambria curvirostris majanivirus]